MVIHRIFLWYFCSFTLRLQFLTQSTHTIITLLGVSAASVGGHNLWNPTLPTLQFFWAVALFSPWFLCAVSSRGRFNYILARSECEKGEGERQVALLTGLAECTWQKNVAKLESRKVDCFFLKSKLELELFYFATFLAFLRAPHNI